MSLRVVIAEDDWLQASALRCQVEHWGCEVVRTVGTGTEALRACHDEHPDLIFMDVQMPEKDGLSATRDIMAECPTCVVVVTALRRLEQAVAQAGGMACVTKPLLHSRIPRLVESALRRFGFFQQVRAESTSPEDATEAWQTVQRAIDLVVGRDSITEEVVLTRIAQRAKADGSSLATAAARIA